MKTKKYPSDMSLNNYYYNEQIRKYIVQFMAVFHGLQVDISKSGEERNLIRVPIKYGSTDRIVAAVLTEQTQNKPINLPIMSARLLGLELNPELRKGVNTKQRQQYLEVGDTFPDDIKTVESLMPIPYNGRFELVIMASNSHQLFQMLEQILVLFDPTLPIQISDDALDWTRLNNLTLDMVSDEETYPSGTDRRIILYRLEFITTVYLTTPRKHRNDIIKEIKLRIQTVSRQDDILGYYADVWEME